MKEVIKMKTMTKALTAILDNPHEIYSFIHIDGFETPAESIVDYLKGKYSVLTEENIFFDDRDIFILTNCLNLGVLLKDFKKSIWEFTPAMVAEMTITTELGYKWDYSDKISDTETIEKN